MALRLMRLRFARERIGFDSGRLSITDNAGVSSSVASVLVTTATAIALTVSAPVQASATPLTAGDSGIDSQPAATASAAATPSKSADTGVETLTGSVSTAQAVPGAAIEQGVASGGSVSSAQAIAKSGVEQGVTTGGAITAAAATVRSAVEQGIAVGATTTGAQANAFTTADQGSSTLAAVITSVQADPQTVDAQGLASGSTLSAATATAQALTERGLATGSAVSIAAISAFAVSEHAIGAGANAIPAQASVLTAGDTGKNIKPQVASPMALARGRLARQRVAFSTSTLDRYVVTDVASVTAAQAAPLAPTEEGVWGDSAGAVSTAASVRDAVDTATTLETEPPVNATATPLGTSGDTVTEAVLTRVGSLGAPKTTADAGTSWLLALITEAHPAPKLVDANWIHNARALMMNWSSTPLVAAERKGEGVVVTSARAKTKIAKASAPADTGAETTPATATPAVSAETSASRITALPADATASPTVAGDTVTKFLSGELTGAHAAARTSADAGQSTVAGVISAAHATPYTATENSFVVAVHATPLRAADVDATQRARAFFAHPEVSVALRGEARWQYALDALPALSTPMIHGKVRLMYCMNARMAFSVIINGNPSVEADQDADVFVQQG